MISRAKGIETQLLIIPYTVTLYKEGESILQLSRIESVIWSYINGKRSISDAFPVSQYGSKILSVINCKYIDESIR